MSRFKELTHREKIQRTWQLKNNLFFHLQHIWDAPVMKGGMKLGLTDYIKKGIWSVVSGALQLSYAKGYRTGYMKGYGEGFKRGLQERCQKENLKH